MLGNFVKNRLPKAKLPKYMVAKGIQGISNVLSRCIGPTALQMEHLQDFPSFRKGATEWVDLTSAGFDIFFSTVKKFLSCSLTLLSL